MTPPTAALTGWLAALLRWIAMQPTAPGSNPPAPAGTAGREPAAEAPGLDPSRLPLPGRPTIALAARNGAASLLWSALRHAQRIEALAPEARALLRAARDREAALGLESTAVAERLIDALLASSVPVIALKGLALRNALYGPVGLLRAPGDIDIMVPREQLDVARALLVGQGFTPIGNRVPGDYTKHQHIEPYTLPNSPSIIVDVHWTPLHPRSPYRVDVGHWWKDAVPLEGSATGLMRLGDLDLALQYALQIDFADAYAGKGRGLFDIAAWVLHRRIALSALHELAYRGGAAVAVPRVTATIDRTYGATLGSALGVRATPSGIVGAAWRRAVDASLWLPLQQGRIPLWYVHYCSRALGRAPNVAAALWAMLKPVLANPRLGGKGFQAYPQ